MDPASALAKGHKHALLITKGFKDLFLIDNQSRPKIFDLNTRRPSPLYSTVVEVDERVTLVGYNSDPKAEDMLRSSMSQETSSEGTEVMVGPEKAMLRVQERLSKVKVVKPSES
ncbi:hypothetical protein PM082_018899 [Marasmius tenuissimus]|nr:hypothetical protein PM082_018899 [Marasmius tenuissimus]